MLSAAVIHLRSLQQGSLSAATGKDVQGFWFNHLRRVNPAAAEALHANKEVQSYALSPVMDAGLPLKGRIALQKGQSAWLRVAALNRGLSHILQEEWLARLPGQITLGGLEWQVCGFETRSAGHAWAGCVELEHLSKTILYSDSPPHKWRLRFLTPTAFRSSGGHLPFPLPGALLGSWLRRWNRNGGVPLPREIQNIAQENLLVNSYNLKTVPVKAGKQLMIGCVGEITLEAKGLNTFERAAIDFLCTYAFWAGSGHHTTRGFGLTSRLPLSKGFV